MNPLDVTLVVNLHWEGDLCRPSLDSASAAVATARASGLRAELVYVLDCPDDLTLRAVDAAQTDARIEVIDVHDLGEARNHGVASARSRYLAFLDGDDLCCRQWLVRAVAEARSVSTTAIVHPHFNFFFGRGYAPYFWVHPDMRTAAISAGRLLVENLWTSSLLAESETFRRFPYRANRLLSGFGYEDWVWNIETSLGGCAHVTAPDTIHFIRRKLQSLVQQSNDLKVLPRVFGIAELAGMTPARLREPLGTYCRTEQPSAGDCTPGS